MILKTNKMLFVTFPEDSSNYIEHLRTEYNTDIYLIKVDRTEGTHRSFYDLFRMHKNGKQELHEHLFSTSKIDKLVRYINDNL